MKGHHGLHSMRKKGPVQGWKARLDTIMIVVAILAPLMTLPQVYRIFSLESALGVSLFSWSAYILFSSLWLMYAFIHKDKPLIITSTLWVLMEILVVIGILLY